MVEISLVQSSDKRRFGFSSDGIQLEVSSYKESTNWRHFWAMDEVIIWNVKVVLFRTKEGIALAVVPASEARVMP